MRGSHFIPTDGTYYVKLEGVKKIGYRTLSIAGVRDSIMISKIDEIIDTVKDKVWSNFENFNSNEFFLDFKIYGKNGAMGIFENLDFGSGQEIGIVIEAVAPTQELANTICSFARSTLLHFGYDGRISTAGNLAFPFSPSDFKAGEVYEFSVYSLMESPDPCKYFPVKIKLCNKGELNNV